MNKNKFEELTLPYIKIYCKATVTNLFVLTQRQKTIENLSYLHIYSHLIYNEVSQEHSEEKVVFSINGAGSI